MQLTLATTSTGRPVPVTLYVPSIARKPFMGLEADLTRFCRRCSVVSTTTTSLVSESVCE